MSQNRRVNHLINQINPELIPTKQNLQKSLFPSEKEVLEMNLQVKDEKSLDENSYTTLIPFHKLDFETKQKILATLSKEDINILKEVISDIPN